MKKELKVFLLCGLLCVSFQVQKLDTAEACQGVCEGICQGCGAGGMALGGALGFCASCAAWSAVLAMRDGVPVILDKAAGVWRRVGYGCSSCLERNLDRLGFIDPQDMVEGYCRRRKAE